MGRRALGKRHGGRESIVFALPLYLLYDRRGHSGGAAWRRWVGVEAAETGVPRAEAARVLGMRAVTVCHGLGWPRGGVVGRDGGVLSLVSFGDGNYDQNRAILMRLMMYVHVSAAMSVHIRLHMT